MGWLFAEPVLMFETKDGMARPMTFSTDDFRYYDRVAARVPKHEPLPGVAGFRLNAPLNRADLFDEVVAFLGASYFRALGRDNAYGLSARGLAINTGLGKPEEFPRFSKFWLETPAPFAREVAVYAALESESCTGAYRFVIRPGAETEIDVTARLFFRNAVDQIGIAPLTSMFLFSEKNRAVLRRLSPQRPRQRRPCDLSRRWRSHLAPAEQPAAPVGIVFRRNQPARVRSDAARPQL